MRNGSLGKIFAVKRHIDLKRDFRPSFQHLHWGGLKKEEQEVHELYKMLIKGVIEPAVSKEASPVVFAPKKDEKVRYCVDNKNLNVITV